MCNVTHAHKGFGLRWDGCKCCCIAWLVASRAAAGVDAAAAGAAAAAAGALTLGATAPLGLLCFLPSSSCSRDMYWLLLLLLLQLLWCRAPQRS
jgi:hypothetical protein